jgi:hypothetical protein
VQQLGPVIPWLNDQRKTPQDPGWHAEGNVHIHTGMVLEELYQLLAKEAAYLSGQQRQSLILAAIFHDIGKTRNTRKMTIRGQQRIGSPDHEAKGRSYLAFQLMKLPLPISVIWTVLGLVGEHQMPKMLAVQNMDHGAYIALSRRADLALLYWLERARDIALDIAIAVVWVVFGVNMIMTILRRRERHLYVAIWFYIATFVTVADVRSVFNKFGGNLGTTGSLAFLFDHKCVFTFKKKEGIDGHYIKGNPTRLNFWWTYDNYDQIVLNRENDADFKIILSFTIHA